MCRGVGCRQAGIRSLHGGSAQGRGAGDAGRQHQLWEAWEKRGEGAEVRGVAGRECCAVLCRTASSLQAGVCRRARVWAPPVNPHRHTPQHSSAREGSDGCGMPGERAPGICWQAQLPPLGGCTTHWCVQTSRLHHVTILDGTTALAVAAAGLQQGRGAGGRGLKAVSRGWQAAGAQGRPAHVGSCRSQAGIKQ